jgi:exonuclease III
MVDADLPPAPCPTAPQISGLSPADRCVPTATRPLVSTDSDVVQPEVPSPPLLFTLGAYPQPPPDSPPDRPTQRPRSVHRESRSSRSPRSPASRSSRGAVESPVQRPPSPDALQAPRHPPSGAIPLPADPACLPRTPVWMWIDYPDAREARGRRPFYALCVARVDDDGCPPQPRCRLVFEDCDWEDVFLEDAATEHRAHYLNGPPPQQACDSVRATLQAMADGTYCHPQDPTNDYVVCGLLAHLHAWTPSTWRSIAVLPVEPPSDRHPPCPADARTLSHGAPCKRASPDAGMCRSYRQSRRRHTNPAQPPTFPPGFERECQAALAVEHASSTPPPPPARTGATDTDQDDVWLPPPPPHPYQPPQRRTPHTRHTPPLPPPSSSSSWWPTGPPPPSCTQPPQPLQQARSSPTSPELQASCTASQPPHTGCPAHRTLPSSQLASDRRCVPHGARPAQDQLRIATHNVSGLQSAAAVHTLVLLWTTLNVDIVCVQETWAGRSHTPQQLELWLRDAAEALGKPPYTVYWANNTSTDDSGHNGVAILVRPSPLLTVTALPWPPAPHPATGRLMAVQLSWAGHDFPLINAYFPSQGPAQRTRFITHSLRPAMAGMPAPLICGDFNFTEHSALDRAAPEGPMVSADRAVTRHWRETAPDLHDVFRHLHPDALSYTFHRGQATRARLDRFYAGQGLLPFVRGARVHVSSHGNHHALLVCIGQRQPQQPLGPGRLRLPKHIPAVVHMPLALWAQRAVQYGLTLSPAALLAWWPTMQRAYLEHAQAAHCDQALPRRAAQAHYEATQQDLQAAEQAVATAPSSLQPQAVLRYALACYAHKEAAAAIAQPHAVRARHDWLHQNEQPSRHITDILRPAHAQSPVPPLMAADGQLQQDHAAIADILAAHYAAVSTHTRVTREAQAAVLQAVRDDIHHGRLQPIPAADAANAGAADITTEEVLAALATTRADASPGIDGISYSYWRVGDDVWAPLLAKLFSAMGATGVFTPGFTSGTITPLFKSGAPDASRAVAYRPITLLPALYRVLTKVLAARFGAVLALSIGPEQCAYLPGRRIEDNINFTALLPAAMRAEGTCGAAVFLDIAKAYDTVDRPFLYRAMRAMGASDGMVHWTQLLLAHTPASVQANGVESRAHAFHAGVRQGCPLSPILYLFIGQALTSWLRAQPTVGVTVGGQRHVSNQFADDTGTFQQDPDPPAMDTLTGALNTFNLAANQGPNFVKSNILMAGDVPLAPAPPDALAGIPVVTTTVALAIPHSNTPALLPAPEHAYGTRSTAQPAQHQPYPAPVQQSHALDWTRRLAGATAALARVGRLPLSYMGRGLAASAYALSKFLYHAEFTGLPIDIGPLQRNIQATVRHTAAIPYPLLTGRPADGGFGLLPLVQHVQARHAAMACRLLHALLDAAVPRPPWMQLASVILAHACPSLPPPQFLLLATQATADNIRRGILLPDAARQPRAIPPGPLQRMAAALQALGPLTPSQPQPLSALSDPVPAPDLRQHLAGWAWVCQPPAPTRAPVVIPPAASLPPVRCLTDFLQHAQEQRRHAAHTQYLAQALQHQPTPLDMQAFRHQLSQVWRRLRCDNVTKQVLWVAAVDGLPGTRIPAWTCPCTAHPPPTRGRQHILWDCPVALAVRHQVAHALNLPVLLLTQSDLWLLRPPPHTPVLQSTWSLVCCSALTAMDNGRAYLWKQRHSPSWSQQHSDNHHHITASANFASARFWAQLTDYTMTHSTDFAALHIVSPNVT